VVVPLARAGPRPTRQGGKATVQWMLATCLTMSLLRAAGALEPYADPRQQLDLAFGHRSY